MLNVAEATPLEQLTVSLYKVGDPRDHLVAYVYKGFDDISRGWRPVSEKFASLPVEASSLTSDSAGTKVSFSFSPGLSLPKGEYHIVIYRTGPASDQDYYRIFVDATERQAYISAAQTH